MWSQDVRQGVGTLYSPSGSIFVGTYVQDKRQGLGVTYWGARSKKYVAEYMDDTPVCGAYTDLTDDTAEAPATQQLRDAIAAARLKAAAAAAGRDCVGGGLEMPQLQVIQPSQVSSSSKTLCWHASGPKPQPPIEWRSCRCCAGNPHVLAVSYKGTHTACVCNWQLGSVYDLPRQPVLCACVYRCLPGSLVLCGISVRSSSRTSKAPRQQHLLQPQSLALAPWLPTPSLCCGMPSYSLLVSATPG